MRRVTFFFIAGILLAAPVAAHAKTGVEFHGYPDTQSVGKPIRFMVIAVREPPSPGGGSGPGDPVVGAHPLVTFRSRSGRVIRVRAGATNSAGIAHGQVTFTDHGPWSTELRVGRIHMGPEMSEPIHVGIGLTQTIASANSAGSDSGNGFPWLWVLSLAAIGSALLVVLMRRRGRWGAA